MAEKNKKNETSAPEVAKTSHKKANIAVAVIVGIAVLVIIAIAICSAVRVDPLDGIKAPDTKKSEHYVLYDLDSSTPMLANSAAQSKIRTALDKMDFTVMNAILQGYWDYSYNFARNSAGKKITMTASEITEKRGSESEYMIELIYTTAVVNGELNKKLAQSIEVDGETVYFDRLKLVIGNTKNSVGEVYLYPYLYDYANNKVAEDGVRYENYKITPVKVRANTTDTFAALEKIVTEINNG